MARGRDLHPSEDALIEPVLGPRSRAVLSALLDPTLVIDERGRILAASDSVERVFFFRPEELVGRNVSVLMPEPHRSAHDGYLENYRRTGQTNILGRTR